MAKTPSKVRRSAQQRNYASKIRKLQSAGLIGKVDLRKHASPATKRALAKYAGVLSGKESAVQAPDAKTARELRRKFGLSGTGKTVVIPREKGERFSISKSGTVTSVRPNPANKRQRIKKTLGEKTLRPPAENEHLYYVLPERKRGLGNLKRKVFSSFDEMLFYLQSYDINFEDIEDYVEIENVEEGSNRDQQLKTRITKDRQRRRAAKKRASKKKTKKKKSPPRKSKGHSGSRRRR